jgi:hypothetical protein
MSEYYVPVSVTLRWFVCQCCGNPLNNDTSPYDSSKFSIAITAQVLYRNKVEHSERIVEVPLIINSYSVMC